MAVWKCEECGAVLEARCKPGKCKSCGAVKDKLVKEAVDPQKKTAKNKLQFIFTCTTRGHSKPPFFAEPS